MGTVDAESEAQEREEEAEPLAGVTLSKSRRHPEGGMLSRSARVAYKAGLVACLNDVQQLHGRFDDGGRIRRIETCLMNTLGDLNTLAHGKGEGSVWDDSGVGRQF
jgi:hypothetical protein